MGNWLVAEDLRIGYGGAPIASPLTFAIAETDPICAIIGRSGVGKTTLLHTLGGHLPPAGGRVSILGRAPDYRAGDLPIVFQHYGLFPWKSAIGNVELALKCQGVPRRQRRSRALELLDMMQVAQAADHSVDTLSGGMRQRVSLARALGANPKCLLLDEPFSALDPVTKRAIVHNLMEVLERFRIRAVMVTHKLGDALDVAQNILVMRGEAEHRFINQAVWRTVARSNALASLQFELEQTT